MGPLSLLKGRMEKEIIVIKEGFLGSIINDIISWGFFGGMFLLNRYYLGDHWYITIFMMGLGMMAATSLNSKYYHKCKSINEARAVLEVLEGKQPTAPKEYFSHIYFFGKKGSSLRINKITHPVPDHEQRTHCSYCPWND